VCRGEAFSVSSFKGLIHSENASPLRNILRLILKKVPRSWISTCGRIHKIGKYMKGNLPQDSGGTKDRGG
jgi:hypothetical protein